MCVYFTSSPLMCFLVSFLLWRYRVSREEIGNSSTLPKNTVSSVAEASQQFLHILESSPVKTFLLGMTSTSLEKRTSSSSYEAFLSFFDILSSFIQPTFPSLSSSYVLCDSLWILFSPFASLHQPLGYDVVRTCTETPTHSPAVCL